MENHNAYTFEPTLNKSSKMFPKLVTPCLEINELSLRRIIFKSMDANSGYGWDLEMALSVADLYRAFLFLCKTYPDQVIVPTSEVDDFWHLHILDTRNYISDCERMFGYYLHHFPYAGLMGTKISHKEEENFLEKTSQLIERHFPELLRD
jgi:hypothetical protein